MARWFLHTTLENKIECFLLSIGDREDDSHVVFHFLSHTNTRLNANHELAYFGGTLTCGALIIMSHVVCARV